MNIEGEISKASFMPARQVGLRFGELEIKI
jgi:hypothetical protein